EELSGLNLSSSSSSSNGELSPQFIRHINNSLIQIRQYPDIETAWQAARNLDVWAVVHIRKNFTDAIYEKLDNPNSEAFYVKSDPSDEDIRLDQYLSEPTSHIPHDLERKFHPLISGRITVHADMTNKIVTLTTMRNFFYQYQDFYKAVLSE